MVVFFDIDDTLIDSENAHRRAINQICVEYSLRTDKSKQSIAQDWINITNKYLKLYFNSKLTLRQQRINRILEFWQHNGYVITMKEAENVYQYYHSFFLHFCTTFPDTVSSLNALQNYQLGIISNGTYSDQIYKLKNNNLLHYFDHVVISEKVGFKKPDIEIFHYAARKFGAPLSNCIHIGDSYELDYLGGINSGMSAVWLDRNKSQDNKTKQKIHSLNILNTFISGSINK